MLKQLKALAWRVAPDLGAAIDLRRTAFAAYRRLGWRRRRASRPAASGPVVVAGFHGAVLGLGEAARGVVSALESIGVTVRAWDVSERLGHARRLERGETALPAPGPGLLVAHMNPPELLQLVAAHPEAFEGKRVIGYWAWELPTLPEFWKPAFRYVDEVWAPSRFTAEAIRAAAPRGLPVRVVPHPVAAVLAAPDRVRFGLEADSVIVLCAFDLRSTLARKNPLAALEAFRRARTQARGRATLVFKTVGGDDAPDALAALRSAIGEAPDVLLIDEALSAADRDRLLASCDILLSLHRSEGFGLLLAEAMAAGKAVVATGWSGNLDFMDDHSAVLVRHALVPVEDPQKIYRHGRWAEADVAAAGQDLAALIDDPERRQALGARARAMVTERLALPVVADLMRLAIDGEAPPPRTAARRTRRTSP